MACVRMPVACLLVLAAALSAHPIHKRSFAQIGCMGTFNRTMFARLSVVCEECYELFREPDIHTLCRSNCFVNSDFSTCVDALQLTDEQEELHDSARQLYGKRK